MTLLHVRSSSNITGSCRENIISAACSLNQEVQFPVIWKYCLVLTGAGPSPEDSCGRTSSPYHRRACLFCPSEGEINPGILLLTRRSERTQACPVKSYLWHQRDGIQLTFLLSRNSLPWGHNLEFMTDRHVALQTIKASQTFMKAEVSYTQPGNL